MLQSWAPGFRLFLKLKLGNPIYLPKITINIYFMPIHHVEIEMK